MAITLPFEVCSWQPVLGIQGGKEGEVRKNKSYSEHFDFGVPGEACVSSFSREYGV